VYCRVLNNPTPAGGNPVYGWHVVTTGATGVDSASLRLDNATSAPVFATGSRFSDKSPTATGTSSDSMASLSTGDFAFAFPTKNPAASGYGWHMITTGATGVDSSSLRIDQSSSEVIWADAISLEVGPVATSYCDSYQGTGYSGAVGSTSSRAASNLSFPNSGFSPTATGTVAFWMYPLWAGADNLEHVLFDMAMGDAQDRIRLVKDVDNYLVLSVYDTNGGLLEMPSSSAVTFPREALIHIGFTLNSGTLALYLNGANISAGSSSGSGSGEITNVAPQFFLGSDYHGNLTQGAVFDDLIVSEAVMTADAFAKIYADTAQYLGAGAARQGYDIGQGNATSSSSSGTPTSVPHGLGVTPQFVLITERGNAIVYLSAASDATSFYVKSTGSSINFDWRAFA
jgi:hypothetical protein